MTPTSWLHLLEDALLRHDVAFLQTALTSASAAQSDLLQAMIDILSGRIEDAMVSEATRAIFWPLVKVQSEEELQSLNLFNAVSASVSAFLAEAADPVLAQGQVLVLAAACLNDFVSQNYTGPPQVEMSLLSAWTPEMQTAARDWASQRLRLDGEDVYEFSYHPLSLLLAKSIFLQADIAQRLSSCKSLSWWSLRYARVHQDLLEQNSATLKGHIDEIIPKAIAIYGMPPVSEDAASAEVAPSSSTTPDHLLATHLYLESAHIYHGYWQYKSIDECLSNAQRALGVEVSLTGVMGKRTRWQKRELAQLVIQVNPNESRRAELLAHSEAHTVVDPLLMDNLPHNLTMDSDVLLENVALADAESTLPPSALGAEEQALLLAMFENTKKTTSGHITRDEEMMGYVLRVLQESASGRPENRSWALESSALFHRSVLECSDRHAQDRALQQLEELSALFDRLHAPTTVASVAALADAKSLSDFARSDVLRVRMRHVWLSNYPSIWTLKLGIAGTFQAIGLYKSALDIFITISAYDGVIESCMLLGKLTQAEELIRQRLEEKPEDPKLLCLLADCTRDITHYERAWEVSKQTYPRAQRSLANYKMQRGLHADAIPHFQLALDINPVFPAEWYAMGWCAMQISAHDVAAVAFSRTVSFDPEYANAWNNLAAAHLHMKNKPAGFSALEQAIKFKADSWKLWENYMITAVDLREFGKAISAMEKVVTLKAAINTQGEKEARLEAEEKTGQAGKQVIDEQVLEILCRVVCDAGREDPQTFIVGRFLQLLTTITQHVVNNPLVYSCLADIYAIRADLDKMVLSREKQVRFLQDAGARWTEKIEKVQDVVRGQEQLIDAYLRTNTRSNLMAGKFSLDTLINKLKKLPIVTDSNQGKMCLLQLEGMQTRVAEATAAAAPTTAPAPAASSAGSSSLNIWR